MKTLTTLLAIYALSSFQTSHAADADDFAEALTSASSIRALYNDALQTTGVAPQSLNELGIDEHYLQSSLIEHVDIDPQSGAIMFGFTPTFGQNQWFALIPNVENYNVSSWACQSTVGPALTADSGCRENVEYDHLTTVVNAGLFDLTLRQVNRVQVNAAEAYASQAKFPQRLEELDIDRQWLNNAYVDHAIVEPSKKSILFGLSEAYGINQWLVMSAHITRNGRIYWRCKTTLPRSMVNTRRCSVSVKNEKLLR